MRFCVVFGAVFQDCAVCGNLKFYDAVNGEEMYLRCCILTKSHSLLF